MSVDKFKFISPGIFIDEVDESQVPQLPERMGPVVIGRFKSGPSNRPVKVESFKDFVQLFGDPSPGVPSTDSWRTGALNAPTYAAYAIQAWLRNNSPCNVIRLLGKQSDKNVGYATSDKSQAGWRTDNIPDANLSDAGGAYGLFVMPNPDSYSGGTAASATLVVTTNNPVALDGDNKSFTLVSFDGTSKTYKFNNGGGTDNANEISSGVVRVNLANHTPSSGPQSGETLAFANEHGLIARRIQSAITGSNGHGSKFVVTVSTTNTTDDTLTITNATAGIGGNKTIDAPVNADASHYTINGGIAATQFTGGEGPAVTGTLAAIWYVQDGAVQLEGIPRADSTVNSGSALLVKSTNQKFKARIVKDGVESGNVQKAAEFSFNRDDDQFIRKVFNTNPTRTNGDLNSAANTLNYWLGETFETSVQSNMAVTGTSVSSTGEFLGFIAPLDGNTDSHTVDWHDHLQANIAAATGFFISQDTRGTITDNFKK